ncbi:MAG TPA: hypothetical protein VHQ24_11985 [Lachnospiraceae bacterium]|nr:hypothetical protein [Lachnospiraceae bacterium]
MRENNKLRRRIACIVAITILAVTMLSACSSKGKADQAKAKGRYVESEVKIPKEIGKDDQVQLIKNENGLPIIVAYQNTDQGVSITQYSLQENGEWATEPITWLKGIGTKSIYNAKLMMDGKGNQYFFYDELIDESYKCHLLVKTEEETWKEITFSDWNKYIEESGFGYYDVPRGVAVLENGNIVGQMGLRLNIYNPESGEIIDGIDIGNEYDVSYMKTNGNQIIIPKINQDRYGVSGIGIFHGDNIQSEPETIDYESTTESYSVQLAVDEKDDIIMLDTEGIHVLKSGTTLWNTVVIGAMNTMYMPTVWCTGLQEDNKGNYYALYSNEGNQYQLMKYTYDKDMNTLPEKELTIYTLADNTMLRQTAVKFSQMHPDVMVSINVAMPEGNADNKTDYIKALNTKLLSGSGEDIIVLDGLPTSSYIEKSVLLDISDIIKPLVDSKELLGNVMNDYITDGKIYSVPTRINPYFSVGHSEIIDRSTTINDLVQCSKEEWKYSLLGPKTPEDLMALFLPIEYSKIFHDKKSIDKEQLTAFLEEMKAIYDSTGGVLEYTDEIRSSSSFDLPSETELVIDKGLSMYGVCFDVAVANFIKGSYTSFENAYNPVGEVGINAASKQESLAKQYVQLLLSEDIQDYDYYLGFPVNQNVLDGWDDMEGASASTSIVNENGEEVPFNINWLDKKDRLAFIDICKRADNKATVDDNVLKVMSEKTKDYFAGKATLEETVGNVMNELSLYLAE